MQTNQHILCIGGLDPAGCAGISADIATINQLGGHTSTVVSTLTVQTESSAQQSQAVANGLINAQLRALLTESKSPATGIKVGLIKDGRHWAAIGRYRTQQPLVIDPVISSSSGLALAALDWRWKKGFKKISAQASLITPNVDEWALLKPLIDPNTPVLVTGHREGDTLVNSLYQAGELQQEFRTPYIEGEYRGTGCRLASAITFFLSGGETLESAIEKAMETLRGNIQQAYSLGDARIPSHQISAN